MYSLFILTITILVTDGSLINCYTESVVYYNSKREGEKLGSLTALCSELDFQTSRNIHLQNLKHTMSGKENKVMRNCL